MRRHIVKHLQEAIDRQSDKAEADRHRDDVRYVVAKTCHYAEVVHVLGRQEQAVDQHPEIHHAGGRFIRAEEPERLEVMVTNAVSDPRAMMVHLEHTTTAVAAMVRTLRLPSFALIAEVPIPVWQIRYVSESAQTGRPVRD